MKLRYLCSFMMATMVIVAATGGFAGSAFSMTDTPSQEKSMDQQTGRLVADLAYLVDTSKTIDAGVVKPIGEESPKTVAYKTVNEAASMLFLGITLLLVAGIARKRAIIHQKRKESRIKNAQFIG